MAATTNFSYLLLLIALTSSVIAGSDDTSSVTPIPVRKSSLQPSSSVEYSSNATNDKNVSKLYTAMMAEGGPITIFSTTQHTNFEIAVVSKSNGSKPEENVSKERTSKPSVVPRKGVKEDKIKARKGVDLEPERTNSSLSQTEKEDTKPVMETSTTTEIPNVVARISKTSGVNISKSSTANQNDGSDRDTNSHRSDASLTAVSATHASHANNNATTLKPTSSAEKHVPKPKPTVTTVDGPEVDESRPMSSRTTSSLPGMPRKLDYIMPVVITAVALPILGAALFMLYRRGRDCWDKRHYRRMDFLIDGMYND